jgi:hypothetical protein
LLTSSDPAARILRTVSETLRSITIPCDFGLGCNAFWRCGPRVILPSLTFCSSIAGFCFPLLLMRLFALRCFVQVKLTRCGVDSRNSSLELATPSARVTDSLLAALQVHFGGEPE